MMSTRLIFTALVFLGLGLSQTPQPLGKLVDVGGYRVHLYCTGSGGPTVVITGAGYSFDWSLVQPEVAKFVRVCSYDHSGIASDSGPDDSCTLRVAEVHAALKSAGINGPYVLIGHSLGALVARLYAAKYPGEVTGMVIVDHAMRLGRMPSGLPPPMPMAKPDLNAGFEKLPADAYRLHVWANSLPGVAQVMSKNGEMVTSCSAEVDSASPGPSNMPVIAISTPMTRQLHLTLFPGGKQVIAERSGHYIMIDRPVP